MTDSHITVTPSCAKCGGALETKDEVRTDASIVTCKDCGAEIGSYGDVQAKMRETAIQGARDAIKPALDDLRNSFRRLSKIKIG